MMNTPNFYNDAPKIALHDPLAEFLGAAENGGLSMATWTQ